MLARLPPEFVRRFIRTWLFPAVLQSFWKRLHRRRLASVLEELQECFPEQLLDEYVVSPFGTCLLMFPRRYYIYEGRAYLALDPQDASRLCRYDASCFFSIGYIDDVPEHVSRVEIRLHVHQGSRVWSVGKVFRPLRFQRHCFKFPKEFIETFLAKL